MNEQERKPWYRRWLRMPAVAAVAAGGFAGLTAPESAFGFVCVEMMKGAVGGALVGLGIASARAWWGA